MFRFRASTKLPSNDLLNSALYDERYFYGAFMKDLKHVTSDVLIESPYLTVKRAKELAPIFKKLKKSHISVRINTREPKHHDRVLRAQSIQAIVILKKAGVKVYVCSDFRHRKIAILDKTILWEGSLNILSQSKSREIMRRTDSRTLCKQMLSFTGIQNKFW